MGDAAGWEEHATRRRAGGKVAAMTLTSTGLVLLLDEVGSADAARVGPKAATLGELRRAGFPVPDGVVLTTEALARTLIAAGLDAGAASDQVEAAPLPGEVAAAVAAVAGRLGGGPLAVRSSGVDEDLPGASYAGQYETVLGVPAGELADAVRRCWASAFTSHLAAYRRARGAGREPGMAVLVQPLVAAEAAGVAFSVDPVTGDRDTAVVNAVRGLGDRLVAGTASPDEWLVRGGEATCRAAPGGPCRPAAPAGCTPSRRSACTPASRPAVRTRRRCAARPGFEARRGPPRGSSVSTTWAHGWPPAPRTRAAPRPAPAPVLEPDRAGR